MTIDAVLVAMFNLLPYKINIETQEKDLEELYERVSNTTEPIVSLETLKLSFDVDKYKLLSHTHSQGEFNSDNIPSHILKKLHVQKILKKQNEINGKQYIVLTKDDIKQLFSVENWRDKQLNKLV
jgi:hypothetical protein